MVFPHCHSGRHHLIWECDGFLPELVRLNPPMGRNDLSPQHVFQYVGSSGSDLHCIRRWIVGGGRRYLTDVLLRQSFSHTISVILLVHFHLWPSGQVSIKSDWCSSYRSLLCEPIVWSRLPASASTLRQRDWQGVGDWQRLSTSPSARHRSHKACTVSASEGHLLVVVSGG